MPSGGRIPKFAAKVVACFLVLVALLVANSTAQGYHKWWFGSGGTVSVDGVQNGYLHRDWRNSAVIITRVDSKPSQSYLIQLNGKNVVYCGDWHAPRFPIFRFGDVNTPCFFPINSEMPTADYANSSTLTARRGFVGFHTKNGHWVTASW